MAKWFFISSLLFLTSAFCKVAIGIDFGATSKVSIITSKRPANIEFVLDEASSFKIPTQVAFTSSGIFFGHQASRLVGKQGVTSIYLAESLFTASDPWGVTLDHPNSPKNLLSVSTLFFNYIKTLCDDHVGKLFGSKIQHDSLVISVLLRSFYIRFPNLWTLN